MLEILNNRTEHTHENEQFRRVVDIIEATFEQFGYDGLLIGNPFNELYSRFRADAILYYDNGIVLIDFKDYNGVIALPKNEDDFHNRPWHNESPKDRSRLEIKAGSRFINPFKQLLYYRKAFKELIEKNKYFNGVNPARVCIINIFSGPIEIHNKVPRNLPYYRLIQESNLSDFLYDFASDNTFTKDIAISLKTLFPAEKWIRNISIATPEPVIEEQITEINNDIEKNIVDFLKGQGGGILVLESVNTKDRDDWLRFATNEAINHNIPQIERWSHSARISKKIQKRSNIETEGIYGVIYGGSDIEEQNENSNIEQQEELLEVIPLKSSKDIDKKALVIITEAHLVSRSLSQSELLRFGSGRLLEDVIKFIDSQSDRKIIFIGDPYSLTFGKDEDTALNLETLSTLYSKEKIKHYRKPIESAAEKGKEKLKTDLAISIENSLFNTLNYSFDEITLIDLKDDTQRVNNLYSWFAKPLSNEPDKAVLLYSKKDCLKTNSWIKRRCLQNGENLAVGDLLITNNNVIIPDESGFQIPRRIVNGMFFTVLDIKETQQKPIKIPQSQSPIVLSFTKIRVRCLSLSGLPETEVWILDNYFNSEDELIKEEQIAFRVFVNSKISAEQSKKKFIDSQEYYQLLEDDRYKVLSEEDKKFIKENYGDLRKFKKEQEEIKNVLKFYKQKYDRNIFFHIKDTDPFVNAVFVKYGWAITVHKAIGSNYDEVIIKGYRKENDGITNDSYFRWLYSGVTAGKTINMISPQTINPFMQCVFEDSSANKVTITSKQFLIFEAYKAEARFVEKTQFIDNENVLGAVCEISKLLEQNGYFLESTRKFTEYLTKAHYSIPQNENQELILNIDNKGSKDNFAVGNIRIEKLNDADENFVKQCIEDCLYRKQNISSMTDVKYELPTDFRASIYYDWIQNCENKKITLKIIQSHNNQDIFHATYEKDTLAFRVWYGTSEQSKSKGFFSKIEVLEKSSETILVVLKGLIHGF